MIQKDADIERRKKMENKKIERLVEKASKGNNKAFEELVTLKLESIMFGALRILRQHQDAEDATQEIIIKMHSNIRHLQEPAAFNLWLHKIIRNYCYDFQGKKSRKKERSGMDEYVFLEIEEKDREFLPQDFAEDKENRMLVREVIKNLPDQRRQIVTLFYYDDLSYKEIGELMELPVNTVGSELMRAKAQIKEDLEKTGAMSSSTINKAAAIPVLSQVLSEQAKEEFSQASINNILNFTKSKVLAGATAKQSGLFTAKKIVVGVLCTAVLTGGTLYACDGLNFTDQNQQNAGLAVTESAVSPESIKEPTATIIFENGDCDCGHANPKDITISPDDSGYENVTWIIKNKKTNEEYSGQGTTITSEVKSLFENKQDGDYNVKFQLEYPLTTIFADRDFVIDTGDIQPGAYQ